MRTITASEARQEFADVIEAARREPVIIQRQKRDVVVVMSVDEYERSVHLNVAEFQRFSDRGRQGARSRHDRRRAAGIARP